ncbi:MAG: hypothetical protein ACTSSK_06070 [Candidatus Heimdallarchaeota archaeon]
MIISNSSADIKSVNLEQLLILHNHSILYREDFKMPTPGFPDIIMFKKLDRMLVGTMLAVGRLEDNPISPWDLPIYTRAIDVSKELLDFAAEAKKEAIDEDEGPKQPTTIGLDTGIRRKVDYKHLTKMSQTKLASVRLLIEEIVAQNEGV